MKDDGIAVFPQEVRRKAARMARGRARGATPWRHLVHVGVLGWMFILPVVGGAFLGGALARITGRAMFAIGPLLLGVAAGAYGVWRQVRGSLRDDDEATSGRPKEGP
jgi:ATP synthase protein I